MNKKESIVLIVIVIFLIILNIIAYMRREEVRKDTAFLIEEFAVKISVNQAMTDELELLPGIGPALADRIISYREEHGDFEDIGDLKKVKGIGDRVLEQISPFIKLE
jgi:comEA protein